MNKRAAVLYLAGALCAADGALAASASAGTLRRFVVVAGANYGGSDRVPLRYAVTDGENFAKVLEEMGGVEAGDRTLLREPSRDQLNRALREVRERVDGAAQQGRTEVVLYYSGHADEKGLLLGDERFAYQQLRREMESIPADVHITVLDACASGAITRLKGGRRYESFLIDDSMDMEGYAFITSSSEDEAAQESDRINGSFFTHYLVSGLRGAADVTGDGRVTLSEAYQFAFSETLTRTAGTQGGAQHPAYDINLTGTGDVVMTDVRETSAGVVLGEGLHGRFFIRNANEQLVAELFKPAGRSVELGLEPGRYVVHVERLESLRTSELSLQEGQRLTIEESDFVEAERVRTALRGGSGGIPVELSDQYDFFTGEEDYSLSLSVLLNKKQTPFNGLQAALLVTSSRHGTASQVAGIANLAQGSVSDLQLSPFLNHASGGVGKAQLGFANFAEESVGLGQLAGGVNYAGARTEAQLAGFANFARKEIGFAQLSFGVNYAGGDVERIQGAGLLNFANHSVGFGQFSGGINYIGSPLETRVQAAAFANLTRGDVGAGQGTFGLNFAEGDVSCAQLAGVANAALGDLTGVQLASIANYAGELRGAQGAIGLNVAQRVKGIQAGAVNVARTVEGAQIGLVNVSETIEGPSIGLFTYSKNGLFNLNAWGDETGLYHLTATTGSRSVFTSLSAGFTPLKSERAYSFGLGTGMHFGRDPDFLEVDINNYFVVDEFEPDQDQNVNNLSRLRASVGYEAVPGIAFFGGISCNLLWMGEDSQVTRPEGDYEIEIGDEYRGWVGFHAGMRMGR